MMPCYFCIHHSLNNHVTQTNVFDKRRIFLHRVGHCSIVFVLGKLLGTCVHLVLRPKFSVEIKIIKFPGKMSATQNFLEESLTTLQQVRMTQGI